MGEWGSASKPQRLKPSRAATPTRAEVADSTVGADAIATFIGTDGIHGAGVGGSTADESARGENDGHGAKDESLHEDLLPGR
jgi:hypothetical protein